MYSVCIKDGVVAQQVALSPHSSRFDHDLGLTPACAELLVFSHGFPLGSPVSSTTSQKHASRWNAALEFENGLARRSSLAGALARTVRASLNEKSSLGLKASRETRKARVKVRQRVPVVLEEGGAVTLSRFQMRRIRLHSVAVFLLGPR
ncbi:hypothetical protein PGIGA_G00156510 [Pangasianodon gigas]|uniref:Uncharacterized protein n=1 Tax=Pangasianodon gigas TaxID=30993 RepID=A0ACC5XQB5_PANGG|nr:hypothetical protein [Pangasianodon gigas]